MGLKNLLSQAILDLEFEYVQITSEFYQYTLSHPFVSIETISENRKFLSKQSEPATIVPSRRRERQNHRNTTQNATPPTPGVSQVKIA